MSILFESKDEYLKEVICYCEGHCPLGEEYGNCQTKPGGKCFTSVDLDIDEHGKEAMILSYGCLPPNEMALFQCRSTLIAKRNRKNIKCCDEYDYCNQHLLPIVPSTQDPEENFFDRITMKVLLSSLLICFIFVMIIIIAVYLRHRKKIRVIKKDVIKVPEVESARTVNITNVNNVLAFPNSAENGVKINFDSNQSRSSTDYGLSGLVQRTISKQLRMQLLIATGTFSEVWRAKWRGEKVAVKIYKHDAERFWLRETDIYQTVVMRHDNILGFIAADIKDAENGAEKKFLVITEYHEQGCLRDFLKNNTVNPVELLQMTRGLSSGLNHLHNEIFGCKGKPAVAHSNINSCNILVNRNKECCWGDFKRAVKFSNTTKILDAPDETENSQTLYLAPEILEDKFDRSNFESFKMSDVYSFSLVLWEMVSRCHVIPIIATSVYKLPYEDLLPSMNQHDLKENLLEIVAIKKSRPELKTEWNDEPTLNMISRIIKECWSPNPSVRLTSLRIKKNLFRVPLQNAEV